jgi:hypothetical protein
LVKKIYPVGVDMKMVWYFGESLCLAHPFYREVLGERTVAELQGRALLQDCRGAAVVGLQGSALL